jgi:hypothetical protein
VHIEWAAPSGRHPDVDVSYQLPPSMQQPPPDSTQQVSTFGHVDDACTASLMSRPCPCLLQVNMWQATEARNCHADDQGPPLPGTAIQVCLPAAISCRTFILNTRSTKCNQVPGDCTCRLLMVRAWLKRPPRTCLGRTLFCGMNRVRGRLKCHRLIKNSLSRWSKSSRDMHRRSKGGPNC